MELILVKMTRSYNNQHVIFCDFELQPVGLLIKGWIFYVDQNKIFPPGLKTQNKVKFTPITFLGTDVHKLMILKARDEVNLKFNSIPILQEPTPIKKKYTPKHKHEARKNFQKKTSTFTNGLRPAFQPSGARPQKDFVSKAPFQKNNNQSATLRVWTRPDSSGNPKKTISDIRGKGFVDLSSSSITSRVR